jgi:predicted RNA-binding protein with PUA-like domain
MRYCFYYSVNAKEIVGIAKVVREFYQDPTTDDDRWVVVDLEPVKNLKTREPWHKSRQMKN